MPLAPLTTMSQIEAKGPVTTPATSITRPGPVAVVIPCYRVRRHILDLLRAIGPEVDMIFVVDDKCPENSGDLVEQGTADPRIRIIRNSVNLGVGGTVIAGYHAALAAGAAVIVKLDGDGQMDPALIPQFVDPILSGSADYSKGNRFFEISGAESMPAMRKLGNLALSFFTKLSSGYWNIFDPCNGYTAIHATAARFLPLDKISSRYFFESDMLFRLSTVGAVVCDIPMAAKYGDEQSGIAIFKILPEFLFKNTQNFGKRVLYSYFLKDFNIASIELVVGLFFLTFGTTFGIIEWVRSFESGVPASAGTVMLAALPILLGVQLLLSFLNYDVSRAPTIPMHRRISPTVVAAAATARQSSAKPS
jgi:dolichol-phosphate mannosyltransferase